MHFAVSARDRVRVPLTQTHSRWTQPSTVTLALRDFRSGQLTSDLTPRIQSVPPLQSPDSLIPLLRLLNSSSDALKCHLIPVFVRCPSQFVVAHFSSSQIFHCNLTAV